MTDGGADPQGLAFCYRCGHLWTPRSGRPPKRCPRCHSCRWDVPERKVRACRFCGTEFTMASLEDPCPHCGRRQNEPDSDRALHCNQCDYDWYRRGDSLPQRCPLCHSTEWASPKAERLMCQQCGHVWRRQAERPERCPLCQSKIWDRPLRAVRCQRCGHVWKMRSSRSEGAVSVCPRCKSRKWNEPMLIARRTDDGATSYAGISSPPEKRLMTCRGCGAKWYAKGDEGDTCPVCGKTVDFRDRVASTSMTLWVDGGSELMYVTENGYGCVYLMDGDVPVSCLYIHQVLERLGMTIGDVIRHVNVGDMRDIFAELARYMDSVKGIDEAHVGYFMKRLSLSRCDATILALHFTGMSPSAIAKHLSYSDGEIAAAFDRIMSAYADSGIIVDDTIFTEDPFSMYRRISLGYDENTSDIPESGNKVRCFQLRIY